MSAARIRGAEFAHTLRRPGTYFIFPPLGIVSESLLVAAANKGRTHIQLQGLPRTVLPADVQRAVIRGKLMGVTDGISLPYAIKKLQN